MQNKSTNTSSSLQEKGKTVFANLTSSLNMFVSEVEKGITKASEEVSKAWSEATDQRFRRSFKDIPADERLMGEYWAQCVTGGKSSSCACYVSTNYFSFIVELPNGKAHVMIPLRDIVNIQPAVAIRVIGSAPAIQPVADPRTKADAIQIYTRDMKLHQFFSFLHFDKAFLALQHSWQLIIAPQTYSNQGYAPTPYYVQANQTLPQLPQTGAVQVEKSQHPAVVQYTTIPQQQPQQTIVQPQQIIPQPQQIIAQPQQIIAQPAPYQPTTTTTAYPPQVIYTTQGANIASDPYMANTVLPQPQPQQPNNNSLL